jgi:hypothetical protein
MPRPKREGARRKEVLIRLEPEVYELARAVSAVTRRTFQGMLEPVITQWLQERWGSHQAIDAYFESCRLAQTSETEDRRAGGKEEPRVTGD